MTRLLQIIGFDAVPAGAAGSTAVLLRLFDYQKATEQLKRSLSAIPAIRGTLSDGDTVERAAALFPSCVLTAPLENISSKAVEQSEAAALVTALGSCERYMRHVFAQLAAVLSDALPTGPAAAAEPSTRDGAWHLPACVPVAPRDVGPHRRDTLACIAPTKCAFCIIAASRDSSAAVAPACPLALPRPAVTTPFLVSLLRESERIIVDQKAGLAAAFVSREPASHSAVAAAGSALAATGVTPVAAAAPAPVLPAYQWRWRLWGNGPRTSGLPAAAIPGLQSLALHLRPRGGASAPAPTAGGVILLLRSWLAQDALQEQLLALAAAEEQDEASSSDAIELSAGVVSSGAAGAATTADEGTAEAPAVGSKRRRPDSDSAGERTGSAVDVSAASDAAPAPKRPRSDAEHEAAPTLLPAVPSLSRSARALAASRGAAATGAHTSVDATAAAGGPANEAVSAHWAVRIAGDEGTTWHADEALTASETAAASASSTSVGRVPPLAGKPALRPGYAARHADPLGAGGGRGIGPDGRGLGPGRVPDGQRVAGQYRFMLMHETINTASSVSSAAAGAGGAPALTAAASSGCLSLPAATADPYWDEMRPEVTAWRAVCQHLVARTGSNTQGSTVAASANSWLLSLQAFLQCILAQADVPLPPSEIADAASVRSCLPTAAELLQLASVPVYHPTLASAAGHSADSSSSISSAARRPPLGSINLAGSDDKLAAAANMLAVAGGQPPPALAATAGTATAAAASSAGTPPPKIDVATRVQATTAASVRRLASPWQVFVIDADAVALAVARARLAAKAVPKPPQPPPSTAPAVSTSTSATAPGAATASAAAAAGTSLAAAAGATAGTPAVGGAGVAAPSTSSSAADAATADEAGSGPAATTPLLHVPEASGCCTADGASCHEGTVSHAHRASATLLRPVLPLRWDRPLPFALADALNEDGGEATASAGVAAHSAAAAGAGAGGSGSGVGGAATAGEPVESASELLDRDWKLAVGRWVLRRFGGAHTDGDRFWWLNEDEMTATGLHAGLQSSLSPLRASPPPSSLATAVSRLHFNASFATGAAAGGTDPGLGGASASLRFISPPPAQAALPAATGVGRTDGAALCRLRAAWRRYILAEGPLPGVDDDVGVALPAPAYPAVDVASGQLLLQLSGLQPWAAAISSSVSGSATAGSTANAVSSSAAASEATATASAALADPGAAATVAAAPPRGSSYGMLPVVSFAAMTLHDDEEPKTAALESKHLRRLLITPAQAAAEAAIEATAAAAEAKRAAAAAARSGGVAPRPPPAPPALTEADFLSPPVRLAEELASAAVLVGASPMPGGPSSDKRITIDKSPHAAASGLFSHAGRVPWPLLPGFASVLASSTDMLQLPPENCLHDHAGVLLPAAVAGAATVKPAPAAAKPLSAAAAAKSAKGAAAAAAAASEAEAAAAEALAAKLARAKNAIVPATAHMLVHPSFFASTLPALLQQYGVPASQLPPTAALASALQLGARALAPSAAASLSPMWLRCAFPHRTGAFLTALYHGTGPAYAHGVAIQGFRRAACRQLKAEVGGAPCPESSAQAAGADEAAARHVAANPTRGFGCENVRADSSGVFSKGETRDASLYATLPGSCSCHLPLVGHACQCQMAGLGCYFAEDVGKADRYAIKRSTLLAADDPLLVAARSAKAAAAAEPAAASAGAGVAKPAAPSAGAARPKAAAAPTEVVAGGRITACVDIGNVKVAGSCPCPCGCGKPYVDHPGFWFGCQGYDSLYTRDRSVPATKFCEWAIADPLRADVLRLTLVAAVDTA